MKIVKFISSVTLALMLAGCCSVECNCPCAEAEQPKISVFAHFIKNTAKQQNEAYRMQKSAPAMWQVR